MQPAIYEETLTIPYYLVDRYDRIKLPQLMSVLIEISGGQTAELATTTAEELGLSWVIIQYEFKINRMPKARETIRVKTFAKEYNRIFSYREFEVYDEEDNLLVSVMTVFALIDENRKMSRIPQEIVEGYGSTESRRIKRMPKPETPKNIEEANNRTYHVRYFDIDSNFHANNAMYFVWMLDVLGDEFLSKHDPVYGNVVFEKEVHIGEDVESFSEVVTNDDEENISRHQIQVDAVKKCIGTFKWVENENVNKK